MARVAYPKEFISALEERIRAGGRALHLIAADMGVSPRMVSNHKKKMKLTADFKYFTAAEEAEMLRLWGEYKTTFEIGSALGRTRGSVEAHLHRMGLKRYSWTDHKVLAKNMLAEGDVALIGTPHGTLLALQDRITDIAEKHGVSRRTIRRAMLEIPASEEERRATRGATLPPEALDFRASDFFQDLRESYGEAAVDALLSRLRAGEDPHVVTNDLGLPLNLRMLERNFRWAESSAPKGSE